MAKSNNKRKSGKVATRKVKVQAIPKMIEIVYLPEEHPMLDVQMCNLIQSFVDEPHVSVGNELCHFLCQIAASYNMIGGGVGVAQMKTPEARTIVSAIRALEDISQRQRKTEGMVKIKDTERMTLLAAKGNLVACLEQIPAHVWKAADRDVKVVVSAINARERAKRKLIEKSLPALASQIADEIQQRQAQELEAA